MSTPTNTSQAGRTGSAPERSEINAVEAARAALAQTPPIEPSGKGRERVIFIMMLLVSMAIAGMLHLQAGFSLPLAALGGAAAFVVSASVNALSARSAEVTQLRMEIARLELELARVKTQGPATAARPSEAAPEPVARPQAGAGLPPEARWDTTAARRTRLTPPGTAGVPQPNGPANNASAQGQAAPPAPRTAQAASPAQDHAEYHVQQPRAGRVSAQASGRPASEPRAEESAESADIPAWAAPSEAQGDALREDWEALAAQTDVPAREAPAPRTEQLRMPPGRTIEADLELVQRKIKALADEVNANEALKSGAPSDVPSQSAGIDESIAALRTTADRMKPARKGFAARPVYNNAAQQPQPAPSKAPPPPSQNTPIARPPQREPQAAFQNPPSAAAASPSAGGPGTLPSLDMLIPATAQPIAVSTPPPGAKAPPAAPAAPAARPEPEFRREEPRHEREQSRHDEANWAEDRMAEEARRTPEPARNAPRATDKERAHAAPAQQLLRQANKSETAVRAPAAAPPAPPAEDRRSAADRRQNDRRFAEIAAAIEQSRMDVFLNPIVGLGDYAVTHFEIDVRLKSETGGYLEDAQKTLQLHSNDLLSLFDIQRLERTARVGEQLEARGKPGSLLSPTAGQSMSDGRFLEAFAHTFEARTSISGQLVLTFTQSDIESFGQSTWQALADMNSFGFRFAVSQVTHLGMDFAALAERGFAFVKLPAEAFLDGLPAGHGMVPPADICRHLSGAGLTLVVEAIEDDQLLARVFGFGALFGQGSLFGGARQITLDALGPRRAA